MSASPDFAEFLRRIRSGDAQAAEELVRRYESAIRQAGLAVVLLARPRTPAADLSHGLAAGLVAAYVSSLLGGVWAFAGVEVEGTFYGFRENENSLAFKWNWLHRVDETRVLDLGEFGQEVYEPDWQEKRYPDLKGLPAQDQRRILYDKMACDAVIGVQTGLLKALPLYFTALLLLPALQALAAEARQLEHCVAELVNDAYGLTAEEVALMWRTAPPRMPGESAGV